MTDSKKSKVDQLREIAEMEGYEEGTEKFERRLRQLKVVECRDIRGESSCTACKTFDYCELAKQVLREHRGY
jgi:hypothetical protein